MNGRRRGASVLPLLLVAAGPLLAAPALRPIRSSRLEADSAASRPFGSRVVAHAKEAATRTPPEPPAPLPPPVVSTVTAAITEEMSHLGIPGLSVAIAKGEGLLFANGYGFADVENEVAAGPDTIYRLASVSKPITAAIVLRLAERNLLDLNAPVWSYCAAYPAKPQPVTAREILCHQGGVRNYRPGETPLLRHCEHLAEGLALFKDDPLVFEPGTSVLYSTYAYTLAGCAAEGAAGRSFAELLREEVFAPAGMTHTQPEDVRAIVPHRAGGYVRTDTGELRLSAVADLSCKVPGGGLCGTAPDVARFGAALLAGRIVGRATLQRMLTPQKTRTGRATGFGLGLTLSVQGGTREAWHVGGQERVSTVLYTRPETGLSIAILSNLEGVGTPLMHLARAIADVVGAHATR